MFFNRHDDDGYGNAKIAGSFNSIDYPIQPKPGSVKAAVLNLMLGMPDGICRRDAANLIDVYELSNRIGELQADGWIIHKSRCTRHNHKQRFTCYSI